MVDKKKNVKNKKNSPAAEKKSEKKNIFSSLRKTGNAEKQTSKPSEADIFFAIQNKAYDLYLERGGSHGNDQLDWYHAEGIVRSQKRGIK